MTKKVVVTGGAGFIGSHLVEEALARGCDVSIIDDLSTGFRENIPYLSSKVAFFQGSIQDRALLKRAFTGAETVFHLAALISVPESMKEKRKYMEVNTLGMVDVLEAAVEAGVRNLVFSSSAAVYGDNPISPKVETLLPEPLSPYALNKLDGEHLLEMYSREYGLNAIALRYFNVFGPRQNPKSAYAAAVPIFFERALKHEPITIYGDGMQTRDFIYVKDIVQANFLAAERSVQKPRDSILFPNHSPLLSSEGAECPFAGGGQGGGDKISATPKPETDKKIFNVSSGQITTIQDLVQTIIDITGSSSVIHYLPARPGDIKHSCGSNTKIVEELGFSPAFDLRRGLEAIFREYRCLS
jgi:UDP-glucose 4-epimerase